MNNRIIKFRTWSYDANDFCDTYGDDNISLNDIFSMDGVVFQQFTGLLDINEKEIYEGDICRLSYDYHESQSGQVNSSIDPVTFKNGGFILGRSFYDPYLYEYITKDNKTELEIIGNIFENSEYLK
jgi:uncharacterized phage protein (TIGR01671 family)